MVTYYIQWVTTFWTNSICIVLGRILIRSFKSGLDLADIRPYLADIRPYLADIRPDLADIRPDLADIRPDLADFRPDLADIRPDLPHFSLFLYLSLFSVDVCQSQVTSEHIEDDRSMIIILCSRI